MNRNSSSQSQWQDGEAAEKSRDLHRLSIMMSAWMVPVIVCVVAIVLSLAVAGFLLGDK